HWCDKGHILYCVAGQLTTELKDGRIFVLKPGMSYQVADGAEPHRSRTSRGSSLWTDMEDTLDRLGQSIRTALPGAVTGHEVKVGELTLTANAADMVKVAAYLRDDPACQFVNIIDITAVDWPSREMRFDVVYHFLSPRLNQRIRVKDATDEATPVPSIIGVFHGADWFEREAYDL